MRVYFRILYTYDEAIKGFGNKMPINEQYWELIDICKWGWHKKAATISCRCFAFGGQVGFEPTTHGTTIRYSNQLSYNRHV